MTVTHVKTYEEALSVALIRNECRKWMTNDQSVLDAARQESFFNNMPSDTTLLIARNGPVPVGFGVLWKSHRGICLTGGLAKGYRGYGWGRELFQELIKFAGKRCWLAVLKTNKRAIKLYESLGFKIDNKNYKWPNRRKDILTMRHDPTA